MPPRYAYWTILIDQKPTAFRAREREELLPTFHQLSRKNADVVLKWFARGRLWESPEAAQAALRAPKPPLEKRGRDWRPGGEHRDPRDRFKKRPSPRAQSDSYGEWEKAGGRPASRPWADKPRSGAPRNRPPASDRPKGGAPRGSRPWNGRPPSGPPRAGKPWSSKPPGPPGPRRANDRRDRPWTQPPPKSWTSAPETDTRKPKPDTPGAAPPSKPIVSKRKPPRGGR